MEPTSNNTKVLQSRTPGFSHVVQDSNSDPHLSRGNSLQRRSPQQLETLNLPGPSTPFEKATQQKVVLGTCPGGAGVDKLSPHYSLPWCRFPKREKEWRPRPGKQARSRDCPFRCLPCVRRASVCAAWARGARTRTCQQHALWPQHSRPDIDRITKYHGSKAPKFSLFPSARSFHVPPRIISLPSHDSPAPLPCPHHVGA